LGASRTGAGPQTGKMVNKYAAIVYISLNATKKSPSVVRDAGPGRKETKSGKRKWSMAELFADERCSGAILEFIWTTDVGRKILVARAVTVSVASTAEQECPQRLSGWRDSNKAIRGEGAWSPAALGVCFFFCYF